MTQPSPLALRTIALYLVKKALPLGASRFDLATPDNPNHSVFTTLMTDGGHEPSAWIAPVKQALEDVLAEITAQYPDFANQAVGQTERIQTLTANPALKGIVKELSALKEAGMRDLLRDIDPPGAADAAPSAAAKAPSDASATSEAGAAANSTAADDDVAPGLSFTPLSIPKIDRSLLSTADRIVSQATNGAVRSVFQIIETLDNAQKVISKGGHYTRKAVTPIPADGPLPSGKMRMLPAASVFATKIPPEHAHRFTFDIPVYTWDAPHPYVPTANPNYQFDHKALRQALWGIAKGLNTVLVGPTGCGKTTMAENIAAHLGRPFFRIPVHGEMRKRDMIGGFKQVTTERGSETQWFDGLLTKAITMPSIVDLDEIDRADPDLQYVAHQAYERKGITILDDGGRYIAPHPDHAILATANTKGRDDGENAYGLRQEMSEATRDRFALWVDCDYMQPDQELIAILADCPGLPRDSAERSISFANLMRGAFKSGRLSTTCSYRQLTAVANWIESLNPRDPLERRAAEIEAIRTILINRVPLASDVGAAEEFGSQIYGDEWK